MCMIIFNLCSLTLKKLCVSVSGFDGRNRDMGGNLSKRFVEQLVADLKMDLVINLLNTRHTAM